MSTDPNTPGDTPTGSAPRRFVPFVPEKTNLREMTLRAVILGLVMTVILGAANAYLGLRAGMTIAATYPAAIIGMAVLRLFKGFDPRGEHRPNRGLDRRVDRRRGRVHDSRVLMAGCWSDFSVAHGLGQIERPDDRRRFSGHLLRHAAASRHGRGPGPSFPGIDRSERDPQGRPEGTRAPPWTSSGR